LKNDALFQNEENKIWFLSFPETFCYFPLFSLPRISARMFLLGVEKKGRKDGRERRGRERKKG
jgi:hypothetical protein